MKFKFEDALMPAMELNEKGRHIQEEIQNMNDAVSKGYEDDRASVNLPSDTENLARAKEMIRKKSALNPEYIVVVGIGGSNLGTIAVQEAVLGKLYNQLNPKVRILYSDTVDADLMQNIIGIIEPVLKRNGNVIVNVISKSGGTTETIANFEVFVELLKKYKKKYEDFIVVTSDSDSKFLKFAEENGFDSLDIPKKVGGRYSVFSGVGLFPLGMLGVDIDNLLEGAIDMRKKCLNFPVPDNPAALSAILLDYHSRNKHNIADLFLFSSDLESVGKWYRQLMGESIGKEFNRKKEQVFNGITPTVSIGSTDLHSMAQLYLGGPHDKFTSFVKAGKNNSNIKVPQFDDYSRLVDMIQGRPLHELMDAILNGVQAAFRKGKRPFVEITLEDKSAYSIGQFLQFKMMEMMYLGFLMDVNPFDQPNVENYKVETKRILGRDK